jgi:hypothetical protein
MSAVTDSNRKFKMAIETDAVSTFLGVALFVGLDAIYSIDNAACHTVA